MTSAGRRRDALGESRREMRACVRCPQLARTRTQVVVGAGGADADLVLVVDAPGREEDLLGVPVAGRAGELLAALLADVGLGPDDVHVVAALKCRPPDNREPAAQELERCRGHLLRELELVEPRVVCPLGQLATRILRGDPAPITRVHGRVETQILGGRVVRLVPLYHPAAALYRAETVEALRADVARLPGLLALPLPDPVPAAPVDPPEPEPADDQLELF